MGTIIDAITSTSLESAKFLPSFLDKPSMIPENRSALNRNSGLSLASLFGLIDHLWLEFAYFLVNCCFVRLY